jgi:hypothetical protein
MKTSLVALVIIACISYMAYEYRQSATDDICKENLYLRAITFEKNKKYQDAYKLAEYLCDGVMFTPANKKEHPCVQTRRIDILLRNAYAEIMSALNGYHSKNGNYPDNLAVVIDNLSEVSRQVARGFSYCKKINPKENTSECVDGSFASLEGEIAVGDGRGGYVSFNLNRKSKPRPFGQTQSCTYDASFIKATP